MALHGCQRSPRVIDVIPVPSEAVLHAGSFALRSPVALHIVAPAADTQLLRQHIAASPLAAILSSSPTDEAITFEVVDTLPGISSNEGYTLDVAAHGIEVRALSGHGLFYGLQTLLQLIDDAHRVPYCHIADAPRFAYRGMMLDVSRHFFDIDFVKRQIDVMARYKLNHLHLHLTDAAGWRIEIPRYPRLTDYSAWRTHALWEEWWAADRHYTSCDTEGAYGGYYTQAQLRELVSYARRHHITLVPEIEMPSHSEEVLAAYPHLSCTGQPYVHSDFCIGNEATYTFLEAVLSDVINIFPSEYIHIGGDEASKLSWTTCPQCKALMYREGLTDADQLQSYFVARIEAFLHAHGRKLLGWDEILDGGLTPRAAVMAWRGTSRGHLAMHRGHLTIMTPGEYCYLDAYQDAPHTQPKAIGGYLPLSKVYSYEPLPDTLTPSTHSLLYGIQGNLFTEYIPTEEHFEYMAYPRMLALSEVAWSMPARKDYAHFRTRALHATEALRAEGYHPFDLRHEVGNRPGTEAVYPHLAIGKVVSYVDGSAYYPDYTAGGDSALVDGLRGGWSYGDRRWQGFLGRKGVDVVIDLLQSTRISEVSADFMQHCAPGVFMPSCVVISASTDGTTYTPLATIDHAVVADDAVTFKTFGWHGEAVVRYIRYQATRSSFGGFLFVDEIVVR